MIQCQCKSQGKKFSVEACGCQNQHLSCTAFCDCYVAHDCLNPFNATREIAKSSNEEIKTDDIDSNLPVDFDDGLKQEMRMCS